MFQASKADFQRKAVETQLGARCDPNPPVENLSAKVSKPADEPPLDTNVYDEAVKEWLRM